MDKLKEEIRKEIFSKLKKQEKEERAHKSQIIKKKLFSSGKFKKARVMMIYVSRDEEVNTRGMIDDALKIGKRVVVPYSVSETKEIIASELIDAKKDLELGPYGIYQPGKGASFRKIPLDEIDLVIVPGVAFDEEKNRLGRGKGYYDRFLKKLPPGIETIGLCFDFQLVDYLPQDSHDFPVFRVITN